MMLGHRGAHCLAINNSNKLPKPNANSGTLKLVPPCHPVRAGNWEVMINRPAACVNPIMTGELIKFNNQPFLKAPIKS